jgi:hypothetical protein
MSQDLVSVEIEFEHEFETITGEEKLLEGTAKCNVRFSFESNYGADADGNRGIPCHFPEEAEDIEIFDDTGEDITVMFEKDFTKKFESIVEELIQDAVEGGGVSHYPSKQEIKEERAERAHEEARDRRRESE